MSNVSVGELTTSVDMDNYDGFNYLFVDCSAGNITIDMTTLIFDGYYFIFNRRDNSSNTVTLLPKTGQTINGTTSFLIPPRGVTGILGFNNDWTCTTHIQN
jgi:hypothetical protein